MEQCCISSPRKNKFKSVPYVGKTMAKVLWNEQDILVNSLPKRKTVIYYWYFETLKTFTDCLCYVNPTRKTSGVLLFHDTLWHTSVRTPECCNKILMDHGTTRTLKSWPHSVKFSPVCSLDRQPVRTTWYRWWSTKHHVPVSAEEGEQLVPDRNTCTCSKVMTQNKNRTHYDLTYISIYTEISVGTSPWRRPTRSPQSWREIK